MSGIHSPLSGGRGLAAALLAGALGCDIRDERPRPAATQLLLSAGIAAADRAKPVIEFAGGYAATRQRAAAEGRPVLLVCTAAWCRFSADLAQRTLQDPGVVAVSRRALCVLLDADRDAEACSILGVWAFPTVLVLDASGAERLRVTGRSPPATLAMQLEGALEPRRVATAADGDAVAR